MCVVVLPEKMCSCTTTTTGIFRTCYQRFAAYAVHGIDFRSQVRSGEATAAVRGFGAEFCILSNRLSVAVYEGGMTEGLIAPAKLHRWESEKEEGVRLRVYVRICDARSGIFRYIGVDVVHG